MTREEAKDQIIDNLHIPSKKFAESYNIVKYTVDFIFDEHEAQLKAKDEEIEGLKDSVSITMDMSKALLEELTQERKIKEYLVSNFKHQNKARSIVAMLFWEYRKKHREYFPFAQFERGYLLALSRAFDKAYAMLKENR